VDTHVALRRFRASFYVELGLQLSRRHQVWVLAHHTTGGAVEKFLANHQNPIEISVG